METPRRQCSFHYFIFFDVALTTSLIHIAARDRSLDIVDATIIVPWEVIATATTGLGVEAGAVETRRARTVVIQVNDNQGTLP